MANVVKKEKSWIENLREEHINAPGDYFYDREYLIRLERRTERGNGWIVKRVNPSTREIFDYHNLSDDDIKHYYKYIPHDIEDILASAKKVLNGEQIDTFEKEYADIDSEALIASGVDKNTLTNLSQSVQLAHDRLLCIERVCNVIIEESKRKMEAVKHSLDRSIAVLSYQVQNIQRVISVLNVYTRSTVEFNLVCNGDPAGSDVPISIRQRILYMDEEFVLNAKDALDIDYRSKDEFFRWLKEDPEARNIILPEAKCVVCMKPRRYKRTYSNNYYENDILNRWNFHTFILVRNGDNIWAAESDNFCIYDSAIPKKSQLEELERKYIETPSWGDELKKEYENINYRAVLYAMFIQGIADNTTMFNPIDNKVNVLRGENVEFIYDDDNLLGSGIKEWPVFLKDLNQSIRRGTRVIYCGNWKNGGYFSDLRYDAESNFHPEFPTQGIYNVEPDSTYERAERMSFLYLPGDEIFKKGSWREDWRYEKRSKKIRWIYYNDSVINYDALSLEDLNRYLNDRTQRKYYEHMIPLLLKARKFKEEEKRDEDAFVELMIADINRSHYGKQPVSHEEQETAIREAIRWWKNKVIYTRPLRSDDAKAWRMIKQKAVAIYTDNQ